MEKFAVGIALGMLGGALLVTNNYRLRTLLKKTQDEVSAKMDKCMDEKIETMQEEADKLSEKAKKKPDEQKEKTEN